MAVQFTDQSSGQIVTYSWSFGDGSSSQEKNPQHIYAAAGTYSVTLTVTDILNRTSPYTISVTVNQALHALFTYAVDSLKVQFTNGSTGQIASYAWDFGDGMTSNDPNPLHAYPAGGTYTTTLTVTSGDGSTDSHSEQVTVTSPVQANFTFAANGLTVQFTDASSGAIAQYNWDFGDGNTATDASPSHAYATDGTYTVTLNLLGSDGSTDSHSEQVTVTAPVKASFTFAINGLSVQFTDASSGAISQHTWDFGNGFSSTEANPSLTYATSGTYTVTLSLIGSDGSTDSHSETVAVNAPVKANFNFAINGLSVQFADASSGPIAQYIWDFGDGNAASDASPNHDYATDGTYTVTLNLIGSDGSTDSHSESDHRQCASESQFHLRHRRLERSVHRCLIRPDCATQLGLRRRQRLNRAQTQATPTPLAVLIPSRSISSAAMAAPIAIPRRSPSPPLCKLVSLSPSAA